MRRRLDLGASLVGAPRLLLLDEPTTGLDPRSRIELWDAIRALVADGTDVLLTTQYLDEADQLASRIVIVDHGRVVAARHAGRAEAPDRRPASSRSTRGARDQLGPIAERLGALASGDAADRRRHAARHASASTPTARARWPRSAPSRTPGIALDDIALRRPTLDEVFLALTGRHRPTTTGATARAPPERNRS